MLSGVRALVVDWDDTNAERRSSAELLAEHLRLLESGEQAEVARDDGDAEEVLGDAPTVVDGTYTLPYLAHATMEPNNAACRMREDGVLEVWASTESPEYTRMSASAAAGIDKDQVEVHVTFAGGSFGLHSSSGARPHDRGRARRASARLEAPDQGAVAPRGGFQDGPLPRDGCASSPRRGRCTRAGDGIPPADRGRADVARTCRSSAT